MQLSKNLELQEVKEELIARIESVQEMQKLMISMFSDAIEAFTDSFDQILDILRNSLAKKH